MTPEEFFKAKVEPIAEAAAAKIAREAAAEAIRHKSHAQTIVQTLILRTLMRKGLLDSGDIDEMLKLFEASAAGMSRTSPEAGKEIADTALQLRHALTQADGKAN